MQSNVGLIIEEKAADIGNLLVGRLLPFREKRSMGPFVFIDHMGPTCLRDHQNFDVPPHPHIGISTLTYLLEGSIFHRDSLGTAIEIKPGAVNWMTAGKGVVHSERTPEYLRDSPECLHGFQLWVALPKHLQDTTPSFHHVDTKDIPEWEEDGISYKLIAGEIAGRKSAVPVHSPLFFIEIKTTSPKTVNIGKHLFGEAAIYVLEGTVKIGDGEYGSKQLLVSKTAELCEFETTGETVLYIFGGEPLPEPRLMFWNFVHTDRETLEQAKQNWADQNHDAFPLIPGDDQEYVPLHVPMAKKEARQEEAQKSKFL